jgi:NMD protein affecting ribosome stability and mRNA decay
MKSRCHNALTKKVVAVKSTHEIRYCTVCGFVLDENGWPEVVTKGHKNYYKNSYRMELHPKSDGYGFIHYYERITYERV